MQPLHAFIDEYGDPHLDTGKPGVSRAYVVTAVCIWEESLERSRDFAEHLRARNFQSGEMKSSAVGANDGRRLSILQNLSNLDCFVVALCAQKERIDRDSGLQFKKSFIKYFARQMFERLSRYTDTLVVTADMHGSPEFQQELKNYLSKRTSSDLFQKSAFDQVDSASEVLLQVADIYAGSLARIYDSSKLSGRADELLSALRDRVSLRLWPEGSEPLHGSPPEATEHDELIRRLCVRLVENYLQSHAGNDKEEIARLTFLESLLSSHSWGGANEYIRTGALRKEVARRIGEPISEHKFRSSVVAKLRDLDVIIASCSKGYKIPSSYSDLRDYALFANTILPPMISRIGRARRSVREATLGSVDILGDPELAELQTLVEAMQKTL
ncbi:DUF3800 domain-containing protein [Montanilutibacter psychrotolerans]|uniref:DUF3800 domain-containing protein n=1 Tax=Montanilutibacter psychrotolerans TaxID=1327343 RepID=A0A3M8SNH5_9GAMM|nr:DUF3800 domain-containing protein [Lysobacter psychrotolerans]RNF82799.1 DUF3800 domain-containing protein [Lysobacter psychrotolerans]